MNSVKKSALSTLCINTLNKNMEHGSCCMTHEVGNFRVLQKCMQLSLTHQLDFVATSCLLYGNYENEFIELELKAGERTARKGEHV